MLRQTTRSYAGRQVDLELLKHIEDVTSPKPVDPEIAPVPRIVSGIEKAVQRYAKIFLTNVGSVRLDTTIGNEILSSISNGEVQNLAALDHLYSVANADTLSALEIDDDDTDSYGDIQDDERIVSTELQDMEMVYDPLLGGRIKIHILLTTAAGDDFELVIPVSAGITA